MKLTIEGSVQEIQKVLQAMSGGKEHYCENSKSMGDAIGKAMQEAFANLQQDHSKHGESSPK